jgi:hypothetical protein
MPFNPNIPTELTIADAAQMRAQFNGLKALIDAVPASPPGPQGPPLATLPAGESATVAAVLVGSDVHLTFGLPRGAARLDGQPGATGPTGPPFTSFNVASTTTLDPGQLATAQAFYDGASVRFNFGIPRGLDGLQGATGATGATGPAFTSFVVDSVTTLPPSQPATAVATFDGTFVRFALGLPQGQPGNNGFDGGPGPQGAQGPAGEVTAAQLATAIAGTASNTNPIATLDLAISDPPTQSEVQQVLAKLNELVVGLRR